MARKLYEKQAIRRRNGQLANGVALVVYTDAAGTVPADISATLGGSAIAGSQVTTADIAGLGPAALRFYGPTDGTDTLYLRVPSDASLGVQKIEADPDPRLDLLEAGVTSGLGAHEADTTAIHGIVDTSQLETLNTTQTVTAQKTYTADNYFRSGRPWVDVRAYGTNTAAIDAAWAAAQAAEAALYFSKGTDYTYSGTGLAGQTIVCFGAGREVTTITLGSGVYLFAPTLHLYQTHIEGLKVVGGKGLFQHTYTGVNTDARGHVFARCHFKDYTECAISSEASDMPYWTVEGNQFDAANDDSTIGIALPSQTDGSVINANSFWRNRINIKARQAGSSTYIVNNDLIHFDASPSQVRARIWFVPHTSTVNAGAGCVVRDNKFGNELLDPGDLNVLYADEGSGATNSVKMPNLAADSTGYVINHQYVGNKASGSGATGIPFIYSTTPNVRGCIIGPTLFDGTLPSYVLQYRTPPVNDLTVQTNIFGPILGFDVGIGVLGVPTTNAVGQPGAVVDPLAVLEVTRGKGPAPAPGGQGLAAYVNLLTTPVRSFSNASTLTTANVADAVGGADAWEVTFTSATGVGAVIATTTAGKPAFLEFDLKAGSSSPLDQIAVTLLDYNIPVTFFKRTVAAPGSGWMTYRFPLVFPTGTATMALDFSTASGHSGKLQMGRVRLYHAGEPVNTDGLELAESPADWAAPASNRARIYLKDNGSGKTQLVVRFPTGAVQQLAIEP